MDQKKILLSIQILASFGILLALYLLWQQFASPAFQPCNVNATVNCDAIITGEVAKTLGLPTPLYGLIGYIILLIAAFFKKKRLLFSVAVFGLVFCLWIGFRELFQLKVICPVCILCQLIMISIFVLSLKVFRSSNMS